MLFIFDLINKRMFLGFSIYPRDHFFTSRPSHLAPLSLPYLDFAPARDFGLRAPPPFDSGLPLTYLLHGLLAPSEFLPSHVCMRWGCARESVRVVACVEEHFLGWLCFIFSEWPSLPSAGCRKMNDDSDPHLEGGGEGRGFP